MVTSLAEDQIKKSCDSQIKETCGSQVKETCHSLLGQMEFKFSVVTMFTRWRFQDSAPHVLFPGYFGSFQLFATLRAYLTRLGLSRLG